MHSTALVPYQNDRATIFGDTYGGVVNPRTWRPHPYPSLYRGPGYAVWDNRMSYTPATWRKVPFTGFGASDEDVAKMKGSLKVGALVGGVAAAITAVAVDRDRASRAAQVGAVALVATGVLSYFLVDL
jgi:hypothetical protein